MSSRDIFYKVTGETPFTFKRYSIVTGPIVKVTHNMLIIKLSDTGLTGILKKEEFPKDQSQIDLLRDF
jgi:hypothetical protein